MSINSFLYTKEYNFLHFSFIPFVKEHDIVLTGVLGFADGGYYADDPNSSTFGIFPVHTPGKQQDLEGKSLV